MAAHFESLGLLPELISAVEELGWSLPTAVQDEAVPLILGGGDVMIAAETGSGKTGAFALPVLQSLYEHLRGDADVTKPIELNNPLAGDLPSATAASSSSSSSPSSSSFVLSALDRDKLCAVDSSGLLVQTRHPREWGGIRSSFGVLPLPSTHWYFEGFVTDEGLCRIGWTSGVAGSRNLGTDSLSFGFGGTGKKSHNNSFEDYGQQFGLNDVIGCSLIINASGSRGEVRFTKNGVDLGVAFNVEADQMAQGMFPAVVLKNAEMKANFGADIKQAPFKFAPQGSRAVAEAKAEERISGADAKSNPPTLANTATPNPNHSSNSNSASSSSSSPSSPFALIFEPTRELAQQVSTEIGKFIKYLDDPPIRHACFTGGMDQRDMTRQLQGGVHVVVGTPGQLLGLVKAKKLDVSGTRCLVLDEADQLITDEATRKDILHVYNRMPHQSKGVQIIICSATLHSPEIQSLSRALTAHPTWVDLKGKDAIPDTVDHIVLVADPRTDRSWQQGGKQGVQTDGVHRGLDLRAAGQENSKDVLSEGLKLLKPPLLKTVIDAFKMDQCMIFVRTQVDCDNLEAYLLSLGGEAPSKHRGGFQKKETGKENPYSCVVLHGGRMPAERNKNLDAFRNGDVRFLICTDVAARGIDIANLPFVINLTLPAKPEEYIHRIGRVGRADAVGLAISIVAPPNTPERVWWHTCNSKDRGRSCTRTALTSEGGCTVYFDEHDMLKAIEKRLGGMNIPKLERNNLAQGAAHIMEQASKGRKIVDDGSAASQQHVQYLRPTVAELSRLEVTAQCTFWDVSRSGKWANMLR